MGAAYVIYQDPPDETRPMGHTGAKWPADWAPLKKRNKSRSRSPAAERAKPAAAEGEKLADENTPKKGVDSPQDDAA